MAIDHSLVKVVTDQAVEVAKNAAAYVLTETPFVKWITDDEVECFCKYMTD